MNERIKELAEQANEAFYQRMGEGAERGTFYYDKFAEKFAELIVQECAQRCEEVAIKHQVEETTYAAGKKAGAFECAADLKEHFGVEE